MQIGANVRERLSRNFSLQEGGQQHFFSLEPGEAESQLVVRPDSRIIAAFPADNTGVSLWFEPGANVTAKAPPSSHSGDGRQELEVELRSHNSTLGISEAILGSIRTIREKLQDTGEVERVRRESAAFAEATGAPQSWVTEEARVSPGQLRFLRTELDGRPYEATLSLPPEVSVTRGPQGFQLQAPAPFDFRLKVALPRNPLGGYAPEELFSPRALDLAEKLDKQSDPRAERCLSSMQSLMFLARQDKFMAGSWRFMTYFGRDTMLSLMLLQPAITPQAYADGLQSVVDRLSPQGVVAHEEDLGPWAEQHRIHQELATPALAAGGGLAALAAGARQEPIYDYKMVDDDFLLPLATERMDKSFVERNLDKLAANWDHVLTRAESQERIRILDGLNVGDWRDSEEGLGWGKYPGSVNVDLVAASVRSIARMAEGLELSPELRAKVDKSEQIAQRWDRSREDFRVKLTPDQVRSRLQDFMESAPLSPAETAFYLSRPVGEGGPTLGEFLHQGVVPPALQDGLSFMALSLDEHGKPVEIPNTDGSFRLFLGDPPREDVEEILKLLELEYPVGLMTAVGPVVANAAYSKDPVHHRELDRQGYHGAVVWSWQSAMLQAGLVRQKERHPELAPRLDAAIRRLQQAEHQAGPLATSELWTHEVVDGEWKAAPWGGQAAAGGDESNAAQLWSTVYPAVLMRTG
ncbi:MAG: hypothetical protein AMXMBFR33_51700 [Candidatus Xenobia bacterium]